MNSSSRPPLVIAVMGPTASGKTALGVALAGIVGGELINSDSRQAIAELAVGVCKPTAADLRGVVCHGLDWRHLGIEFSAADFSVLARQQVHQTWSRDHVPLLVGGTGLYTRALLGGFDFGSSSYTAVRTRTGRRREDPGSAAQELSELDPTRLSEIDQNNPRRVARALELVRQGAVAAVSPLNWRVVKFGCRLDPILLKQRIVRRSELLLGQPLLEEVQGLLAAGYTPTVIEGAAIGYREALWLLSGTVSREEALASLIRRTWRYARQQLTWLRREPDLVWVDSSADPQSLANRCREQALERLSEEDE
ncbi:MAG TPA: tRNA (adenosine(37)-N6)-dimethylallyltransferase MiaA [Candidatus Dormibacteraeota bacterium]|nr:tRNA (adenosine(37)-N6)-dimethylallyltransferase MiaA [Candidatus Dormibacteraeota bacterium]